MKQGIRRVLVLLLALSMTFSTVALPAYADAAAPANSGEGVVAAETAGDEDAPSALDQVLAAIDGLSNDPREFTADDLEKVEAIGDAYNALSEQDKEAVDSKSGNDHPSGDGQSYGRILEAALWAVRSFGTDTSTTLPDGTYTTTSVPAVTSVSNKGKSDSSRTRNWWVERVVVENGQATAYIYVTKGAATAGKLDSYPSVWIGGQSVELQSDNTYPIPVDLNGTTYFGGVSSSMPRPIMYALETTIDEPQVEVPADYTAVDAALAKVPEDLSIYTDESAQAVTDAVNAVDRTKKASEQAEVDAMAAAINAAVAGLVEKQAEPEKTELTITNNTGMFKAVTAYLITEDGQEYLVMALSGTGYKELYKGTYEQAAENGDGSKDKGNDSWIHGYTNEDGKLEFKIPVSAEDTYVPCVAVSNSYYNKYLNGQNSLERAYYPRQFELDREAKTLVTGDYDFTQALEVTNNVKMFSVSAAALETVGGPNSNNYKATLALTMGSTSFDKAYVGRADEITEETATIALSEENVFSLPVKWVETFGMPETMKSLLGEPFVVSFHSVKKDAWYEREFTVSEENGTLVINEVPADYTAVDAALAKVPEDLSIYTDETAAAVTTAVNAVVRDKKASEQEAVDAMAKAIEDAVAALKEKDADPVLEDGTYTTTKVSTDGGMIGVAKATVIIKDGQAFAIVTMKGTGADRFYVSETATTNEALIAEAVAEEKKEVNGEYDSLLGGLVLPGETATSFWPVPITLGERKVFAARSASHFSKQDKTPQEYWYPHDFQIDAKDLQKVSDSTELPITEQQEAQRYLNQYFMDGKVVTADTAASVKGKDAKVTIPYYDKENNKISSVIFKMAESDKFRSGWFVDSSILNTTYFSSSNLKKIRYPEGASGKVTFNPKAAYRDEGMTFTATLKLYPADAKYNQYDSEGVYYDKEPLAEQTFTFTVEPLPGDRHVTIDVIDAVSKEPVGGASVTVTKDADGSAVEAADGTYALTVPGTYTIKASAEGYLVPGSEETEYVQTEYAPKKDGEKVTISLIKAEQSKNTITFDLKDQMGEAVVNPAITVYPWNDKEAVVAPEADGSYKLYNGTNYGYTVKAEGYEDKTGTIKPSEDATVDVVVNKYLSEQKFTFRVYDSKTNETIDNVNLKVKYGPSGEDESTYTEAQPDKNGVYTIPIDNRVVAYGQAVGYEDNSLGVWSLGFDPLKECSFGLKAMYPVLAVDKTSAGMMKPAAQAFLTGDNTVMLPMLNDSFSAVFVGDGRNVEADKTIALADDNTFTFDVAAFDQEMTIAFQSKKNGNWLNKKVTVSKENGTLVIVDDKADYTKVDAAKAAIPEDLSIYTEASVKAVNDAVAAVKTGKNSAEQAAVDAMAKAIDDAVAKLQLKPADYSKVDAAIAKVPKDMSKYTDASVKAVNDAVKAVVRGKMANEQAAVDNMAKAINNAVAGLKAKEAKKGWVSEGGYWYFYDNSGNMVKNSWAKDSVGWCYLGADGRMTKNAWVTDSHGWCWIGADGYWATGSRWISCNGSWYYISNGYMVANAWQRDSVGWCYLGSDGKMVTNGWASDSHGWCWLGSNGYWTSSTWVLDDGEWYYIKPNHYMAANEWARDSVGWMYMAANGKVTRSQWIKDGGYWYYLKADGYMATGTLKIGSKTYTFASSGRWVK